MIGAMISATVSTILLAVAVMQYGSNYGDAFLFPCTDLVERSCNTFYEISSNGRVFKVGGFTFKGGCGECVPDRCRTRARDAFLACARVHGKQPVSVPGECNGGEKYATAVGNLVQRVRDNVCPGQTGLIPFAIRAVSTDCCGCEGNEIVAQSRINCGDCVRDPFGNCL